MSSRESGPEVARRLRALANQAGGYPKREGTNARTGKPVGSVTRPKPGESIAGWTFQATRSYAHKSDETKVRTQIPDDLNQTVRSKLRGADLAEWDTLHGTTRPISRTEETRDYSDAPVVDDEPTRLRT